MKLSQLPDDFTPQQFMQLDKESLDQIPYDRYKWYCQCKGCSNGTHVRDYSSEPWYFIDRNGKGATNRPDKYWVDVSCHYWTCSKHNKFVRRMVKTYGWEATAKKLLDFNKVTLDYVSSVSVTQQIETLNDK